MTDQSTEQTGETSGQQQQQQQQQQQAEQKTSSDPFYSTWSDDLKAAPSIINAKSPEDIARMYLNAEKRLGVPANRLLVVPDKPDDADGWAKIHAALGRPDTVEGYGLKLPDDASDSDKAWTGKFLEKAHAAGASPAVMKAAFEVINEATTQSVADDLAAAEAEKAATRAELDKAWGAKKAVYDAEIPALVETLTNELNETLPAGAKIEGVIDKLNAEGMGNSPTLLRLLAHLADSRAEGGLPGKGGGDDRGVTPEQAKAQRLALEADPVKGLALRDSGHAQHQLVKAERTKLLAIESGRPPKA